MQYSYPRGIPTAVKHTAGPISEGRPFTGLKGFYCYRNLAKYGEKVLRLWCRQNGLEIDDEPFHCTQIYSPVGVPLNFEISDKSVLVAVSKLEWWEGHDSEGYLVGHVEPSRLAK